MTLAQVDPGNALAVTDLLTKARDWLSTAVETSTPLGISFARAELSVAEEATKHLNLSEEIQEDAKEMVRRAEYALGRAMRKGQDEGTVAKRGQVGGGSGLANGATRSPSSEDLVKAGDVFRGGGDQDMTYAVAHLEPDEFERIVSEAKAEKNLSRANVVRKARQAVPRETPTTRDERADVIADLALKGYTSHQMAERVGVRADRVREIARAYDITISGDKAVGRGGQRIDHTAAVESAVTRLEHLADSLKFIDFAEVDRSEADEWAASLTNSLRALNRFKQQIKETTHVH